MPAAYTIAQAQKKLSSVVRESQQRPVPITKNKQVVGFFLSRDRMESILETIDVMQDKKAMKAIRDYEAGKTKFHPLSALDVAPG
jgi:PHD/YefM family antitoxin component YafN of YafNO toxin-antitoxin module